MAPIISFKYMLKLLSFTRNLDGINRTFHWGWLLSLLVMGASSLLKAVGKKSMTFNLHKKRPTHVSCYTPNMLQKRIPALICITEDTDVSSFASAYARMWTATYSSDVDLSRLLGLQTSLIWLLHWPGCLGLHQWTVCDTISAFAGQGKLKALKIFLREQKFIDAFATLGSSWNVRNELFCIIEEFVCQLYCRNTNILKVNELKYQMFRNRREEMESAQRPPCEDTIKQHTRRANSWRPSGDGV